MNFAARWASVGAMVLLGTGAAAAPATVDAGAGVYRANCARCHGEAADGRSRLAEVLVTKPSNLRTSRLDRAAQERIVRLGGEANGRAALMPAWQGQLSDGDIALVLDYLGSLKEPTP